METSLIAAFIGAQVGEMQLAVAARLARADTSNASSVAQLVDAAQRNFDPLANAAANIGTILDVTA
jgi:hypothetical protein